MQLHIPTLLTERLELVPIAKTHFDAYASIYGDSAVMTHLSAPMSRAEVWKLMARQAGQWVLHGCGAWSVKERGRPNVIGVTGLQFPETSSDPEIGWVFSSHTWGKGYATEAASAVLAHVFEKVGENRVVARIAPANAGSISVARKLGMIIDSTCSDETTLVYAMERIQHIHSKTDS
jgi:RimJ/RimL family protein N-acetyltransferase